MDFAMPHYVSLKGNPTYDENWLQEKITDNPSLLGLGDLVVRDRERRQPNAGRLDLLLSNPETDVRYEVEVQLGATDEKHLVRTIEYWDIERRRYPQYEHIAVIVAEDVTSRFLNVIGLFNQAIPLIAIQIRAVQVKDTLTLVSSQVLGLMTLGSDEEDEGQTVNRNYWVNHKESLAICDRIVELITSIDPVVEPTYKKHYIGLTGPRGVRNFVTLNPRRKYVVANFKIPFEADTEQLIQESDLDELPYEQWEKCFRVRIRASDLEERSDVIEKLIRHAHMHFGAG